MPLLLMLGTGASSPVVHVQTWASDRAAPGNYELVNVFVGRQYTANHEYDTEAGFDAAFTTYKNTPT